MESPPADNDEFYRLTDDDAARIVYHGPPVQVEGESWPTFADTSEREVEWVISGLIPRGMLTCLAGMPKVGKSMLSARWAAELSYIGRRSVLASAEDDPEVVTRARLRALDADLTKIRHMPILPTFSADEGKTEWDAMRANLDAYAPDLLVFDPLTAMIDSASSSHNDQHMRRILTGLWRLAHEFNLAVVYVVHTNKAQHSELLYRVGGSVAFTAAARSVVLMARSKETPQERIVAHLACNVGPELPASDYIVEQSYLPPLNGYPGKLTARLRFLRQHEGSIDDVFTPAPTGEEQSAYGRAKEMLALMLIDGPLPTKEVDQAARAWGISERTVNRARIELGVVAFQENRKWMLRMPLDVSQS